MSLQCRPLRQQQESLAEVPLFTAILVWPQAKLSQVGLQACEYHLPECLCPHHILPSGNHCGSVHIVSRVHQTAFQLFQYLMRTWLCGRLISLL